MLCRGGIDRNQLKTQGLGLPLKAGLGATPVEFFLLGEDRPIVGLASGQEMVDDPGELVGGGRECKESVSEAVWFIGRIRQLYRLEDHVRQLGPAERYRIRQQDAPAICEVIKQHALGLQPKLLPQSTLGKAVSYFLDAYDALIGYLKDGRFEIDNNLVENDIRPTAVGRKRWLFLGHPQAGWRRAVIYSILIRCRRRGLNPQEYLSDVLARLPSTNITQIQNLLPAHCKPPSRNVS